MAKYYNPQGKKRGGFTKLQTGGQASIEALRRQEEPQLRALRQQQQRQSEYDRDVIQGEDRKYNAEFWNRQELKQMEDDIWRHREKAEKVRADREIDALKGKAAEFGKSAKFWEKFSTTYSQQWAKLAQGVYDYVDEEDAKKNFFVQQELLKGVDFFDPANETKTKFTEAGQEVLSKVAALVTKPNLTEEDKKWIDENLSIFFSNAFTLQGKLVQSEEANVKIRFAQLEELLDSQGLKLTKDNAHAVAMNLAYMVSKKAGITDLGLQNRLVRSYTKEANAKYISLHNSGRAFKSEDRFQSAVNDFATYLKNDGGNIEENNNAYTGMIIAGMAVSNKDGNQLNPDPKQALIASVPYLLDAGVPEDKIYELLDRNTLVFKNGYGSELDKEKTFGLGPTIKGSITWRERYKGKGASTLVQDIEDEIIKWKKNEVSQDNAKEGYKDINLRDEIQDGVNAFDEWKSNPNLKDLSKEEAEKQLGVKIIDLKDATTVSQYSSKLKAGSYTKASKLWTTLVGVAGNSNINRDTVQVEMKTAVTSGNASYAEHLLSSGIFGSASSEKVQTTRADMYSGSEEARREYRAGVDAGIFKEVERRNAAKQAIQKAVNLTVELDPQKDPSIDRAISLLRQSELHYFFNDSEVSSIQDPKRRMKAAEELAYADLNQNQGLFFRINVGEEQEGTTVTSSLFPNLSPSAPGLWGKNYRQNFHDTKEDFNKNILDAVTVFGKHKGTEPAWVRQVDTWLPVDELHLYAEKIITGQPERIVYHPRIEAISKKSGLPKAMVVNMLFESKEFTQRIPLDIDELIDINQLELNDSVKQSLRTEDGEITFDESAQSRQVTGIKVTGRSPNLENDARYYQSPASNPTRRLYYSVMNYALKNSINLRGEEPLPANSSEPTDTGNLEANMGGADEIPPKRRNALGNTVQEFVNGKWRPVYTTDGKPLIERIE